MPNFLLYFFLLLLKLREFNRKTRAGKKKTFARRSLKFDYCPDGGWAVSEWKRRRERDREKRTAVFINLYEPNEG